jgi:hypothetical protein
VSRTLNRAIRKRQSQSASIPVRSVVERRRRSSAKACKSAGSYRIARSVARMKRGPRPEHLILSSVDLDRPKRRAASRTSTNWEVEPAFEFGVFNTFSGRPRRRSGARMKSSNGSANVFSTSTGARCTGGEIGREKRSSWLAAAALLLCSRAPRFMRTPTPYGNAMMPLFNNRKPLRVIAVEAPWIVQEISELDRPRVRSRPKITAREPSLRKPSASLARLD